MDKPLCDARANVLNLGVNVAVREGLPRKATLSDAILAPHGNLTLRHFLRAEG